MARESAREAPATERIRLGQALEWHSNWLHSMQNSLKCCPCASTAPHRQARVGLFLCLTCSRFGAAQVARTHQSTRARWAHVSLEADGLDRKSPFTSCTQCARSHPTHITKRPLRGALGVAHGPTLKRTQKSLGAHRCGLSPSKSGPWRRVRGLERHHLETLLRAKGRIQQGARPTRAVQQELRRTNFGRLRASPALDSTLPLSGTSPAHTALEGCHPT